MLPDLASSIRSKLDQKLSGPSTHDIVSLARELSPSIADVELVELVSLINSDHVGLGPLSELVKIPQLTDIVVNGWEDVWIDRGEGLERIDSTWKSESELRDFAIRLAVSQSRRLDELNPFVDFTLSSGIRCHLLLPPLAVKGTQVSLRIPRNEPTPLSVLVGDQTPEVQSVLRAIIHNKKSFMICGGTGSGKTTLLAAMLSEVSPSERVLIIEDTSELVVMHPHCTKLQSRMPNVEGIGEVTMQTLVRQSLRMRPDRIVVGEIRGAEVIELFAALNTGHQGCAATIHANSAADVISRVQLLGLMNGLSNSAIQVQLPTAIDVIIELTRIGAKRIVREIGELILRDGQCVYQPIVTFAPSVAMHSRFESFFGELGPSL